MLRLHTMPAPPDAILENADQLLAECQRNLETSRPSKLLPTSLAKWLTPTKRSFAGDMGVRRALLQHGYVVWAIVLRAYYTIYDHATAPDDEGVMGSIVCMTDPKRPLEDTLQLADEVRGLRGTQGSDPFLRFLNDDDVTPFGPQVVNIPSHHWPEGGGARVCDLFFKRARLPHGFLRQLLIPVVVCPELTDLATTLDASLWPDALFSYWNGTPEDMRREKEVAQEREPTPDELLESARYAYAEEDWRCVAHFASWGLALAPDHAGLLAITERFAHTAPNPFSWIPEPEDDAYYVANVAFEGQLAFALGDHALALDALASLLDRVEDPAFLTWLTHWLPKNTYEGAALEVVLSRANALLSRGAPFEDRSSLLMSLTQMMERTTNPLALARGSMLARRVDGEEEAIAWAEQAMSIEPSHMAALALGLARSNIGDTQGYVEAFEFAASLGEGAGVRLDLGDHFADLGDSETALSWYHKALELEPDEPWAQAHIRALEMTDPQEALEAIPAATSRAEFEALRRRLRQEGLWRGTLPHPHEACLNLHQDSLQQENKVLRAMTLSAVEAASAMHFVESRGPELRILQDSTPDPQQPRAEISRQLWRFVGHSPRPNITRPSAQTLERLGELAQRPYLAPDWRQRAGSQEPESEALVTDILGAFVHSGETPSDMPPWIFAQRIQFAAAAMLVELEGDWTSESHRRQAILDLLRGPMDWSVSAIAVMAADHVLELEPNSPERQEIFAELLALLEHRPIPGFVCYLEPTAHMLLRFPELDDARRAEIERFLQET